MAYPIEERKVKGVIYETNMALAGKGFSDVEVMIGLSELIGRSIVKISPTHIQMDELKQAVLQHLERTVRIGAHAENKGPLDRV
jgi:hypothetical protein